MACAILVTENNLILLYNSSMHFSASNMLHSLNLIFFKIFFFLPRPPHCSLSEFINRSIGKVRPMRTCILIEQMCLNTQTTIIPVIMAKISDIAKMEDVANFLKNSL